MIAKYLPVEVSVAVGALFLKRSVFVIKFPNTVFLSNYIEFSNAANFSIRIKVFVHLLCISVQRKQTCEYYDKDGR